MRVHCDLRSSGCLPPRTTVPVSHWHPQPRYARNNFLVLSVISVGIITRDDCQCRRIRLIKFTTDARLGMTPATKGSYPPTIAIPDVRIVLDNYGCPDSASMLSLEDASFDALIIPECPNPGKACEASVALLHRENALALRSQVVMIFSGLNPQTSQYRISKAREGGLGVFAVTSFERGECIMRERPLIIYPQMLPFHSGRPVGQQYPELDRAIEMMSPENRKAFFGLMNAQAGEPSPVEGIIDTNALFIGPLPGTPYHYAAVCKDISRINHRCAYSWEQVNQRRTLITTVPREQLHPQRDISLRS